MFRTKVTFLLCCVMAGLCASAEDNGIEIEVTRTYLNIPVSKNADRVKLTLTSEGMDTLPVEVRLADGSPDYWVFKDITALKGRKLEISSSDRGIDLSAIYQADSIHGESLIYKEYNRPQYHFTSKRGWLNDPNGLIYHDGEYHLFYQHDPFDRDGVHKHWGHAVSADLVHWQELPSAISPGPEGDIWSGTAVIDYGNTSGFGDGTTPPMIAAYTVYDGQKETQAIAFSNDRGRTFTKYENNPVIDSYNKWNTIHTRDPKLMRHGNEWIMVLFERDGNSFYTSPDLRNWTYKSHITGFWECPDLFELPVDGNADNTMWVMYGASGTYMLGDFDGEKFTPLSGKHKYVGGSLYAAQTFNNIPRQDGRRIQIAWGRIDIPDAPFNQMMLLPTELSLITTKDGVRMTSRPVHEIDSICQPIGKWQSLTQQQATDVLNSIEHDGLRIKATIKLSHATNAVIRLGGQRIVDYDLNGTAFNGHFYSPQNPESMDVIVDIFIDRGVAEVFVDNGLFSDSMPLPPHSSKGQFEIHGDEISFTNLEVFKINPIRK